MLTISPTETVNINSFKVEKDALYMTARAFNNVVQNML